MLIIGHLALIFQKGDTLDELLANAVGDTELALSIYVDQGRRIPAPSRVRQGQ